MMVDTLQNILILLLFLMLLNIKRPHIEVHKVSKEEFLKMLEGEDEEDRK